MKVYTEDNMDISAVETYLQHLQDMEKVENYEYSYIFVNDGSRDNTLDIIKGFAALEITVTYDEVFQALLVTEREKKEKQRA